MFKIFISHPLSGDFKGNRAKVDKICKEVLAEGYLPISPLHLFNFIDEENNLLRANILQVCLDLIDIADEVWIYGDSQGCRIEESYARFRKKRVIRQYEKS